uniref:Uncharacterized protein n=1 Tax=Arundo donax TaxID=35708 RepID=A0A0A9BQC2_ARUDO
MRLNLLAPSRRVAETQLSTASACESLSLNASSMASTSAAVPTVSKLAEEPSNDVLSVSPAGTVTSAGLLLAAASWSRQRQMRT